MTERKVIEINHGLSGIYGKEIKAASQRITDARKQVLKRLQRKKKLASVIQDELYWYLQRFPEQVNQLIKIKKQGLHQQTTKKKKIKTVQQNEETKITYKCPIMHVINQQQLLRDCDTKQKISKRFNQWFSHAIDLQMQEQKTL